MKKIILVSTLVMTFISCINEKKIETNTMQTIEVAITPTPETQTNKDAMFLDEIDWSKIPESTANIGGFPYLTVPEGFVIWEEGHNEISKNGMTKFSDFSKLILFNGTSFYNAEGKKAELDVAMKEREADFNKFKLDKSLEAYLKQIGAVLLFNGQIPHEKLDKLKETDEKLVYKFIQTAGSPYDNAVKNYVLNHKNAKVCFQFGSNSASAKLGIIELEDFKQTIKAPTASEMQNDIDTRGKAILNINFDTDKAVLKPDGQKIVDEIYILLSNNSKLKLSIEGHTDATGSPERNQQLSSDRAHTVRYALAAKGIDIKRLKAIGFGDSKPFVSNNNDENKAKNRRVELVKI
ncbi:OmpA family protein [Mariniflexile litorale]|uniref:OmpA family protein n=1 Tax=Mariniflexile litorale TaxID=3045158 RepID=A0AAU7EE40_9FLAO|nr:OmpA family protein [Mariniflexile sp. KMM 9835]MDQ8212455.1 OmpA family protein [Mariniflexile sp. KMM 9835]